MKDDFWETIKSEADKIKEETLYTLMEKDSAYQTAAAKLRKAEKKYVKLRETLPAGQRRAVERLLASIDEKNMEAETLNYLAGLKDGISLIEHFNE